MLGLEELALEDACYYLRKLGMADAEIARVLAIAVEEVERKQAAFRRRLDRGEVVESTVDLHFWRNVQQEAAGDVKVTVVDRGGRFYHGWRSQLERADAKTLMMLFEACRDFLGRHPEINLPRPTGYDPLAPIRQVKSSLPILEQILMAKARMEPKGEPPAQRANLP